MMLFDRRRFAGAVLAKRRMDAAGGVDLEIGRDAGEHGTPMRAITGVQRCPTTNSTIQSRRRDGESI